MKVPSFLKKVSGIYQIRNLINNKIYIGSAKCLYSRCHVHKSNLLENKHINPHLQKSFNKYKYENFVFEILEFVNIENLINREQYYLDILKPEYNICLRAGSRLRIAHSKETKDKISKSRLALNLKHSEEMKIKISPKGRIHSEYSKQKCRESQPHKKKVSQFSLEEKFIKTFDSISQANKELGILDTGITNCISGKLKKTHGFKFKLVD